MKEKKESLEIIINDLDTNPKCQHGPTILFSSKNRKYYSCSSNRSKDCFYIEYEQFERNRDKILGENRIKASSNEGSSKEYDLRKDPVNQRIFCVTCDDFTVNTQTDHKSHTVKIISDEFLNQPSLFLPQLSNDQINAQYFFDDSTLNFIYSILDELNLNHIICMGAPRLHDFVRNRSNKKSLLLDIDKRFQPFYPEDFCHYNMLNNYFFSGKQDEDKLMEFLKMGNKDEKSYHCLFTDPPFGARTELLTQTVKAICSLYFRLNHKVLPVFWIFPYFNEYHIQKYMPELEMMDFQVTYMNHHAFNSNYKGRKEGSVVRMFTNIPQNLIKYPSQLSNYRFCKPCNRFVSQTNIHCNICKVCPSKNGASYRHCNFCIKCVKPNYSHCSNCGRCCLKVNHNCKVFQMHQECRQCHERGHVEKYCKLNTNKRKRRK